MSVRLHKSILDVIQVEYVVSVRFCNCNFILTGIVQLNDVLEVACMRTDKINIHELQEATQKGAVRIKS